MYIRVKGKLRRTGKVRGRNRALWRATRLGALRTPVFKNLFHNTTLDHKVS